MPRVNNIDNFFESPDIVNGYPLPPMFSIVVPVFEDRSNIVTNPSFEIDTTNWSSTGAPTVSVSYNQQFVGAKSLEVICTAASKVIYGATTPLSLTTGEIYAVSMRFLCTTGNIPYDFYMATSADVKLSGISFRSTGFWQYIYFMYQESATNSRHLIIATNGAAANTRTFYIDAVQVELTSVGKRYPTTYIDGDQEDFYGLKVPTPYYWRGVRHNSISVRSRYTRSGGRVVNLRDLGFTVNAANGLGLQTPQNISLPFGQIDGEQYLRTRKEAHTFSLAGRVTGRSAVQFDQILSSFTRELERDSFALDQPITMKIQPMDELEVQTGPELTLSVVYTGGAEGKKDNLNGEILTPTFKQLSPVTITGHSEGKSLSVSTSVANANFIARRNVDGSWSSMANGLSGGGGTGAYVIRRNPINGLIYVGGDFTDAGGSGADYAAVYNPVTNTFSVIKSATAFNGVVECINFDALGNVYFGGEFINVDGIANADRIVKYNLASNTFTALGTGAADFDVVDIQFDTSGNLYAGGYFTSMGGVANTDSIAKWNGTVWSALGTGSGGGIANGVNVIAIRGNDIYLGGSFLDWNGILAADRLVKWNGTTSAYEALSAGSNDVVSSMVFGPDGYLYIGGSFESLSGISMNSIGRWNGLSFQPVGSPNALAAAYGIADIKFSPDGTMYVCGFFNTVFGQAFPSAIAKFNGSSFVPVPIDLPNTGEVVRSLDIGPDGSLYIAFDQSGTAIAESVTTVNHHGTGKSNPIFVFTGTASSAPIHYICNITTNQYIFINYSIIPNERIVLKTGPNSSMISSFTGDISSAVLVGSNESELSLIRGNNDISILVSATGESAPDLYMYWNQEFTSAHDAVGVI